MLSRMRRPASLPRPVVGLAGKVRAWLGVDEGCHVIGILDSAHPLVRGIFDLMNEAATEIAPSRHRYCMNEAPTGEAPPLALSIGSMTKRATGLNTFFPFPTSGGLVD